jgi:hypothetical protein
MRGLRVANVFPEEDRAGLTGVVRLADTEREPRAHHERKHEAAYAGARHEQIILDPASAWTLHGVSVLRTVLAEQRLRSGGQGMVFGNESSPFRPDVIRRRANAAWKAAGMRAITLHECRHAFASLMIAAGVNAKALSTYMSHANIAITLDRYGHLTRKRGRRGWPIGRLPGAQSGGFEG